jgi:hypothetical protein
VAGAGFSAGGELLIHEGIDARLLLDRQHFSQIGQLKRPNHFFFLSCRL